MPADYPHLCEIAIFAFNYAPRGWSRCDGQLMPINQNQAMFSLLGTNFGGNGITTFALPDLRTNSTDAVTGQRAYKGLENTGMAYYIALQGIYPSQS